MEPMLPTRRGCQRPGYVDAYIMRRASVRLQMTRACLQDAAPCTGRSRRGAAEIRAGALRAQGLATNRACRLLLSRLKKRGSYIGAVVTPARLCRFTTLWASCMLSGDNRRRERFWRFCLLARNGQLVGQTYVLNNLGVISHAPDSKKRGPTRRSDFACPGWADHWPCLKRRNRRSLPLLMLPLYQEAYRKRLLLPASDYVFLLRYLQIAQPVARKQGDLQAAHDSSVVQKPATRPPGKRGPSGCLQYGMKPFRIWREHKIYEKQKQQPKPRRPSRAAL